MFRRDRLPILILLWESPGNRVIGHAFAALFVNPFVTRFGSLVAYHCLFRFLPALSLLQDDTWCAISFRLYRFLPCLKVTIHPHQFVVMRIVFVSEKTIEDRTHFFAFQRTMSEDRCVDLAAYPPAQVEGRDVRISGRHVAESARFPQGQSRFSFNLTTHFDSLRQAIDECLYAAFLARLKPTLFTEPGILRQRFAAL
ncbi:MAG TPA: hypothetical protein VH575_10820 [Gemmataceae bacterium]